MNKLERASITMEPMILRFFCFEGAGPIDAEVFFPKPNAIKIFINTKKTTDILKYSTLDSVRALLRLYYIGYRITCKKRNNIDEKLRDSKYNESIFEKTIIHTLILEQRKQLESNTEDEKISTKRNASSL